MVDFVRILQDYCVANGYEYHYGKKANLNLLSSDLDINKIYCLHEPSSRKTEMNSNKSKVKSYLFSGLFMLVKKSDLDMPYFKEKNNSESISKYVVNIEPLLTIFKKMANDWGCTDIELVQLDCVDAVDLFDNNNDGIIVTYQIRINEFN
jgi:hypothetical protein